MKKILLTLALAATLTGVSYASPQTTFTEGETEINVGMWNTGASSKGYKSSSRWSLNGGVTYALSDRWAAQYQYNELHTKRTEGNTNEINALYSLHPQVAAFAGWNRISMKEYPTSVLPKGNAVNQVFQIGVIARQPVTEELDVYAKGAIGTQDTSSWEAGVNMALDRNLELNAGYHFLNTRGTENRNVTYKGFTAGVSYRFGGKEKEDTYYSGTKDYDYERDANEASTVSIITESTPVKEETSTVTVTTNEPVNAPENDYYFGSVHFDSDSAAIKDGQKVNIDAFIKQAKETGHKFKLVGRADASGNADYNRDLSARRVKAVKDYAIAKGVPESQIVEMVKGDEGASGTTDQTRAQDRRVDIFEHK